MANSIGHAYSILGGYITGNVEKAETFLNSKSPTKLLLQNRAETRMRSRLKSKAKKMGQRPSIRRAV